jgi:hypothetical protein
LFHLFLKHLLEPILFLSHKHILHLLHLHLIVSLLNLSLPLGLTLCHHYDLRLPGPLMLIHLHLLRSLLLLLHCLRSYPGLSLCEHLLQVDHQ